MDRHDDDKDVQQSGILGLGGSPVPKGPGDPSASHDEQAVQQRRRRMIEGELADTSAGADEHDGATGVDMGAGGDGTDLRPK